MSVTPFPAYSPFLPQDPPASSSSSTNDQWWLVKDSNGAIGLVRGTPGGNVVQKVFVATAKDFNDLLNNHAQTLGNAQNKLKATAKQLGTLISQIDHGAGLHNPNWIYVGADAGGNQVSSNVSTSSGSEADPINQIPSPIPPSVGNTGGGILGSLSFLSMFGNLQFWKGIGLVIAGGLILLVVGRELVRV